MVKILRLTDRVKVKMGELVFTLAPLSNDRKREIVSCTTMAGGETVFDYTSAQHLYIKHSLKDVEGIETYDGEKYCLEFEGDSLTDDCVSNIFTIPQKPELVSCAWQMLNGIPDKLVDDSGEAMKGVSLEVIGSKGPVK